MRTIAVSLLCITIFIGSAFAVSGKTHITQYLTTEEGTLFGISRKEGFVVSTNDGKTWTGKNTGIPKQIA